MLSSDNSIIGIGLNYDELFDRLYESIFDKINPTNQIERNLQISFTKKIISLIEEKDLKDTIKSKALSMKEEINKLSNKKSRSSSDNTLKNHFNYIVFLTSKEN
jgi:L-lysine 2,3-aminomutase